MDRSTAGRTLARHRGSKAARQQPSRHVFSSASSVRQQHLGYPRHSPHELTVTLGNKGRKGERDTVALVHSCFSSHPHHGLPSTTSPCPAPLRPELLNCSNAFNSSQPPHRLQIHAAAAPLLLLALQCLRSPSFQHVQVYEPIPGHKCRTPNCVIEIQQGHALR